MFRSEDILMGANKCKIPFFFFHCSQFGEEVSVASSVALVSERSSNQTKTNPQLHPSVSGDQDPVAALWGNLHDTTQVRQLTVLFFFLTFLPFTLFFFPEHYTLRDHCDMSN